MFTPTVRKLGINFVANDRHAFFTRPKSKSFNICSIKHTTGGIAGCIYDQYTRISPISMCLNHCLRESVWGQTMTIVWISLYSDYSSTCQPSLGSIADP